MNSKEREQLQVCWSAIHGQISKLEAARRLKVSPNGLGNRFMSLLAKQHKHEQTD